MKENTPISPQARAVLGASHTDPQVVADILRAAADQLDHATSAHTLYAIADELYAS